MNMSIFRHCTISLSLNKVFSSKFKSCAKKYRNAAQYIFVHGNLSCNIYLLMLVQIH